jgi:hypothetical protein
VIRLVLAAVGREWDPDDNGDWIPEAAAVLPCGTVLAVRMDPDDDEGYEPYECPALTVVEPGRVARL